MHVLAMFGAMLGELTTGELYDPGATARRYQAGSSSTTGMVRWPARCWYTW